MEKKTQEYFKRYIMQRTGVDSAYDSTEPVNETWEGKTIWSGLVHKFRLINHPDSNFCYTWDEPKADMSGLHRVTVVLDLGKTKDGPIDALTAVRLHLRQSIEENKRTA